MSARRSSLCSGIRSLPVVSLAMLLATGCDVRYADVLLPAPDGGGAGDAAPPPPASRVDLLLVIDNSASMADKQDILALAVPDLVQRLVAPRCRDASSEQTLDPDAWGNCPAGSSLESRALTDLHIGVITSSLGGVGADSCSESAPIPYSPRAQDMAHLVARSPTDPAQPLPTWNDKGFLYWDPAGQGNPAGETSSGVLVDRFASMVRGAGQDGCGFEMGLEAWYRFLVDPAPYERIVATDCGSGLPAEDGGCRGPEGVDPTVLTQRADFLREDSLVVVLMLSDEDDCSVRVGGQNHLVLQAYSGAQPFVMPRGTSACADAPASAECKSCGMAGTQADPACMEPPDPHEDALNLRCWHQKQRFGIDFLYPVQRYVDALTKDRLQDGTWSPLFCSKRSGDGSTCEGIPRDPSRILLAGVVGVPWQMIARDPNDLAAGLLSANELSWDAIAGDPSSFVEPSSPFMVSSVEPRDGVDPITGESVAPPGASSPAASPINGHEREIPERNDLQYACVFELPVPRACSAFSGGCDCSEAVEGNPLCQASDGSYGTTQYRAKAYPAPRYLSVLRGVGKQAVVASICAADTRNTASRAFGYRPAIEAIVEAMQPSL